MKKIVIIGGGYAGVSALRYLAKQKNIALTLIDRHPYHFLQTEGYALVANTLPFDKTIVNLHTLCQGYPTPVSFVHDTVSGIDLKQKRIDLENTASVSYDFLIIAAGSVTRFFSSVSGLKCCSHGVKSLTGAFEIKQFFERELLLRLENARHAKEHYSVLIGGAGLSGVEIAAQMQHYFNRYYKSNTLACNTLKIHLVSGSDTILKEMHPAIISKAETRLDALGVLIHKGSRIREVTANKALLEHKESIIFDFMIFTGGIVASSMLTAPDLPHNALGQIKVTPSLQIPFFPEVFAVGDAAEIRNKNGTRLPDNAQAAIKSGQLAAKNIRRILHKKAPMETDIRLKGIAIALGGRYAILDLGLFRLYGLPAYYIKKIVEKSYKWPLWLRCKIGFQKNSSCQL